MINLETFFRLHFDSKNISDDNLKKFAQAHIQRLIANNVNNKYGTLINDTIAAYDAYFGAITNEDTAQAIQEGRSITVDNLFVQFQHTVSQKEGIIRGTYGTGTAEYEEFFPHGLTEYTNAIKANIETLMVRMVNASTAHVADLGQPFVNLFAQLQVDYIAARDAQLNQIGIVVSDKSQTAANRDVVEIQLSKNVLTLALEYIGQPDKANVFFDQSIIPKWASGGDEGDNGNPPTPSGVMKFDIDETILADIFPKIAGNASATGIEQLNFDHGDGYETVYTLQNGILTGYTISFNTAGVYHAEVTEITAGANRKIAVIQFDNCKLSGTLTIPPDVQATNIEVPMNPLLLAVDMQQESYTNIVSFVVFGCGLLSINEHLIGLDNSGKLNGFANFSGGTNAAPSGLGIAAKNSLIAKGWTVITN